MTLELSLLRGPKIAPILKVGNYSTAFPIYKVAQLSAKPPGPIHRTPDARHVPGLLYSLYLPSDNGRTLSLVD